jgi:hypothetical protein
MADFIAEQADFILFFYGLAFILLGVTCFAIARSAADGSGWPWLGSFGLTHGVGECLDLSALVIGDTPSFSALRTAVMAASYLMLLEFARRNLRRQGLWLPGAWVHAPLVACVILAAVVGGISVANALSRYGLGFVGAVGTGAAFAVIARHLSGLHYMLSGGLRTICGKSRLSEVSSVPPTTAGGPTEMRKAIAGSWPLAAENRRPQWEAMRASLGRHDVTSRYIALMTAISHSEDENARCPRGVSAEL